MVEDCYRVMLLHYISFAHFPSYVKTFDSFKLFEDIVSPDEKEVVLLEWLNAAGMVW